MLLEFKIKTQVHLNCANFYKNNTSVKCLFILHNNTQGYCLVKIVVIAEMNRLFKITTTQYIFLGKII